ncbi:MAG: response regulator transcription factor [Sarcina sp.]
MEFKIILGVITIENILILEDEKEIADLVEIYLKNEGYKVFKAGKVSEVDDFLILNKIDLAILDVMLPDGDGLILCSKIREKYMFPIIMLTAKSQESDRISGLAFGADDYITKPFRPLELLARVKAQIRRYKKYNIENKVNEQEYILAHKDLVLNIKKHECKLKEECLALTPTEFSILKILCEEKGKVVSSEEIFKRIWKNEYFDKNNNTITTHIRHLREKLCDSIEKPEYIKTVWGVGYKIEE